MSRSLAFGALAFFTLGVAIACGDEDAADSSSGGSSGSSGNLPDGAVGDGGPIDPGGSDGGGGPGGIDTKCPPLAMPSGGAALFVDATAAGAGSGTKADPFKSLADAFGAAALDGVIWVAAGTYKENLTIPDKNLVVYGGFASGFSSRTDACSTVIEAANASEPVLRAGASVKSFGLDGVTVRKGARGLSVDGDESGATFTIASSVFAENGQPGTQGGGAHLSYVNAKITRSVFRDNRASKGGALDCGGKVAITIEDSLFERNVGHSDHGGALYLTPTTATIVRNTFRANEIGRGLNYGWGGAVVVFRAGAAPVRGDFAYNVFTDNLAGIGGGVFVDEGATITMSHDLLYRNRSYKENGVVRGAAIYADGTGDGTSGGSTLIADHVTVVNNVFDDSRAIVTSTRGGGVYVEGTSKVTFTNSIFWNNGKDTFYADPSSSIDVSYSVAPSTCAGGGACKIGTGVLQPSDVHFVDEGKNDYHLKSTAGHFANGAWVKDAVTSPAIDKADPAAPTVNEPMPNGGRANLGVYGRTAEASKSP